MSDNLIFVLSKGKEKEKDPVENIKNGKKTIETRVSNVSIMPEQYKNNFVHLVSWIDTDFNSVTGPYAIKIIRNDKRKTDDIDENIIDLLKCNGYSFKDVYKGADENQKEQIVNLYSFFTNDNKKNHKFMTFVKECYIHFEDSETINDFKANKDLDFDELHDDFGYLKKLELNNITKDDVKQLFKKSLRYANFEFVCKVKFLDDVKLNDLYQYTYQDQDQDKIYKTNVENMPDEYKERNKTDLKNGTLRGYLIDDVENYTNDFESDIVYPRINGSFHGKTEASGGKMRKSRRRRRRGRSTRRRKSSRKSRRRRKA